MVACKTCVHAVFQATILVPLLHWENDLKPTLLAVLLTSLFLSIAFSEEKSSNVETNSGSWSPQAAARYLDARQQWWQHWPVSQRDHHTVCVSCHTALPFALSRPALRRVLHEPNPTSQEQILLGYVKKRVELWNEVEPFYTDAREGPPKSSEARGTESVLNALILARHDAETGEAEPVTAKAFDNLWALQLKSGPSAGAWTWLNFHLAPWESDTAQYYGATLAAIAAGNEPKNSLDNPGRKASLKLLESYLLHNLSSQPEANKILVLWASAKLPQLLSPEQKASLITSVNAVQRPDGGWSLAALGPWKRKDSSTLPVMSDGYATGIAVFSLEQAGVSPGSPQLAKGLAWLEGHQDKSEGLWPAYSMNKERKPASDVGRFMTDAATGYAVMALEAGR